MTTQTSLNWRLPSAALFALLAVITGLMLHHHWTAFVQACFAVQITLHRYLVTYLLQLNSHQFSGGISLLLGAFIYGVLHAVGPGHGKFVVTTWLSTHKENLAAARLIPFLGSLMQGVTAIVFVFVLAVGFNLAAGDLSLSRWYIEKASALFVLLFGAGVVIQALKNLKPAHHHAEDCHCHHHHGAKPLPAHADWKTRLGVIFAVGARPCTGAILLLLFANSLGMVSWGMAAVMAMSLGTALAIFMLSLAVRYLRERTTLFFVNDTASFPWLLPALRLAGGIVLILFAMVLFLTVIPVSPNGDYITAGC